MDVLHDESRHRFELETEDGRAVLEYARPRPEVLDLRHTFVPEAARGKDVGDALVRAALDYARASGLRIIPTCPFVAAWLGRHPEQRDLVAG